jgi:cystathionine beta-synthase
MKSPHQAQATRAVRPAVLDLIGNTPLVELTQFDSGCCRLFLKLESQNPGGSIKDRVALSMIEAAERDGRLQTGGTVIEATAGNTGLGLALVAIVKGYRVVLVVPDKMSSEKVLQLKALGAEVYITRSDVTAGHPDYYQDVAARLAREAGEGAFYIDQFNNPANPLAHETTTASEIWQQMGHDVDAIVCGVGSGGTITGLKRYFERVSPETEFVLADPEGSVLCNYIATGSCGPVGSWAVEGIGEDFIPSIADLNNVRTGYAISDEESFSTARELLRREGILAGSSTGTLVAAALRHCRAQKTPQRVLTFACDTGTRYLSKVYNDSWLFEQGLLPRAAAGDLRDLISRRAVDEAVISVNADDTLLTAFQRMRAAHVSQLPVMQEGKLVGMLDESDLLMRVRGAPERFHLPASDAMNRHLRTLRPDAGLDALYQTLGDGWTAVVADEQQFHGLITRFDLLNHLRKSLK